MVSGYPSPSAQVPVSYCFPQLRQLLFPSPRAESRSQLLRRRQLLQHRFGLFSSSAVFRLCIIFVMFDGNFKRSLNAWIAHETADQRTQNTCVRETQGVTTPPLPCSCYNQPACRAAPKLFREYLILLEVSVVLLYIHSRHVSGGRLWPAARGR